MDDENAKNLSLEEQVIAAEKEAQDDYSIYKIIKDDGTNIIAIGSICVTIIAACLRLSSYLYHVAYMKYWVIDPKLITSPETFWLENIALSFLLMIAGVLYMNCIVKIHQQHTAIKKNNKKSRVRLMKAAKEERHLRRKARKVEKQLQKNKNEHSNDFYMENMQKITEVQKELDEEHNEILEMINNNRAVSRKTRMYYSLQILILSIVFGVIIALYLLRTVQSFKELFIYSTTIVFLFMLFAIGQSFLLKDNNNIPVTQELPEEDKENTNKTFKQWFSNQKILFAVFNVIFYCLAFPFGQYYSGHHEAESCCSFEIVTENKQSKNTYAVLACDTDYIIAEEIAITDDTAVIYTDKKYIISKENEPILQTITLKTPPTLKKEGEE